MVSRFHLAASLTAVASLAVAPVAAQVRPNAAPVDRNVADTGANAASLRQMQPGIGQFGVGSLLLDRFGEANPYTPERVDTSAVDPRVSQRYLLQAPGFTALMDRPDYIGPSPQGGWVFNRQTFDGTEILTLTPANTVYVLSPELLRPVPVRPDTARMPDHPSRVLPQRRTDPYALMNNARVNHEAYGSVPNRVAPPSHDAHYRHPAIIERERKLREERAREQREAEQSEPDQNDAVRSDSDASD